MSDRNYTEYQKKVIQRYYDNRDEMDDQRLAELTSNLYLASGRKLAKLWESAREVMVRMRVPLSRVEHIVKSADPALLAEVVKESQGGTLKRDPKPTPPAE